MAIQLGKLQRADLRKIWKNEEYDFSAWLAEESNLSLLSDEIGIDIRLIKTEADVGKFSLDILAEEEGTGRKIIIENQLEVTNHDHLGKIITYAAGHNASIIIWVFKEIREEHRQAIDWLNEHTDEDISFFAVQVEVWQIGDSAPAPKFNIISKPNEWTKIIRQNTGKNELTETKIKQLDFWTKFKSYVTENKINTRLQTPRPQHWYDVSIGSSEAHIALTVNTRDQLLSCEISIPLNKELFAFLKTKKDEVEKMVGTSLEWKTADKYSRIIQRKDSFDIDDANRYSEYFSWMTDRISVFQKVFGKFIKDYKTSK